MAKIDEKLKEEIHSITDDKVKEVNSKFIENALITPDNIYMDFSLIKDLNLGALNTFIVEDPKNGERIFNAILKNIDAYQRRYFDETAYYIKGLPVTEKQILDRIKDPKYGDMIVKLGNATNFLNTIKAQLYVNGNHSSVGEKYIKIPIGEGKHRREFEAVTFHINVWPLKLTQEGCDYLAAFMVANYHVNVKILNTHPSELGESLLAYDEWYFSRFDLVLLNDTFKDLLKDFKIVDKRIFARPIIDPAKREEYPDVKIRPMLAAVEAQVNMMSTLRWIPKFSTSVRPELFENDDPNN